MSSTIKFDVFRGSEHSAIVNPIEKLLTIELAPDEYHEVASKAVEMVDVLRGYGLDLHLGRKYEEDGSMENPYGYLIETKEFPIIIKAASEQDLQRAQDAGDWFDDWTEWLHAQKAVR